MINKEELQRFIDCAEQDKDFTEKFAQAMKAKNVDEVIRLAAEKGFTFTPEDFALEGRRKLDLDELDYAAGGRLGHPEDSCPGEIAWALCGAAIGVAFWWWG